MIELLKAAFVQGQLTKDEFDARAGHALAARTHADLAALIADIPVAAPPGQKSPPKLAQAQPRPPVDTEVKAGVRAIAAIFLVAAGLWPGAMLAGDNAAGGALLFLAFMTSVVAAFSALYGTVVLLDSLRRKRAARPLPPARASQI